MTFSCLSADGHSYPAQGVLSRFTAKQRRNHGIGTRDYNVYRRLRCHRLLVAPKAQNQRSKAEGQGL